MLRLAGNEPGKIKTLTYWRDVNPLSETAISFCGSKKIQKNVIALGTSSLNCRPNVREYECFSIKISSFLIFFSYSPDQWKKIIIETRMIVRFSILHGFYYGLHALTSATLCVCTVHCAMSHWSRTAQCMYVHEKEWAEMHGNVRRTPHKYDAANKE